MRAELAYGDASLGTVGPILGHLVVSSDHSLFSDEMVARVRGMLGNVARQLIDIETAHLPVSAESEAEDDEDDADTASETQDGADERIAMLAQAIAGDQAFLQHCHSLAIEFQLAERLQRRSNIDPVLTPLMQSMVADKDSKTASAAMATLAAQARFMQQQRRMELPLGELPPSLAEHAMQCWRAQTQVTEAHIVAQISAAQRSLMDEDRARLSLIRQLMEAIGRGSAGGAVSCLSLPHAGASIFLSALAQTAGISREDAAILTNDRQMARLALSLRGAALKVTSIEEQFHYLHPDIELPDHFDSITPDRARALLGPAR